MELQLADPKTYQNNSQSGELKKTYDQVCEDLIKAETHWEELHLELEKILQKLA